MMWSTITIFVVPAMVYNNLGPMDAIKKSVVTLKRTWGESLISYFGLGLIQFLFFLLGIIVTFILVYALAGSGSIGIIITVVIALLYFLGVILVFNVANTIFNTALYVYADTGKIPEGYSPETMQKAFRPKEMRNI
jgi:membrane-bound ClpP family serine protease